MDFNSVSILLSTCAVGFSIGYFLGKKWKK